MKKHLVALVLTALIVLTGDPAYGHAERSSETPKEGRKVAQPPAELIIDFTEPPTGDARASVTDGCGNELVTGVTASNQTLNVSLERGQPGAWQVTTSVVSAVDGHRTNDAYSFEVAGEPDCDAPAPETGDDDAAGEDTRDEGSSLPWVAIGVGVAALVGMAVLVRGRS